MDCAECQTHLVDYLYEEVDESLRTAIEAELERCDACRAELDALRVTHQAFSSLPPIEVSSRLHQDMLRQARVASVERHAKKSFVATFLASPAFGVAFSTALLGGGVWLFSSVALDGAPGFDGPTHETAPIEETSTAVRHEEEEHFDDHLVPNRAVEEERAEAEAPAAADLPPTDGNAAAAPTGAAAGGAREGSRSDEVSAPPARERQSRRPAARLQNTDGSIANMARPNAPEPEVLSQGPSNDGQGAALGRGYAEDGFADAGDLYGQRAEGRAGAGGFGSGAAGAPAPPAPAVAAPTAPAPAFDAAPAPRRQTAEPVVEYAPEEAEADDDEAAPLADEMETYGDLGAVATGATTDDAVREESTRDNDEGDEIDRAYARALSSFDSGANSRAARRMADVIEMTSPGDARRENALMYGGIAHIRAGDRVRGERLLRQLLSEFPSTRHRADAEALLTPEESESDEPNLRNRSAPSMDALEAEEP